MGADGLVTNVCEFALKICLASVQENLTIFSSNCTSDLGRLSNFLNDPVQLVADLGSPFRELGAVNQR